MNYFLFYLCALIACAPAHDRVACKLLVGHWTFEKGKELKDLTGNFGDVQLFKAQIQNGKLVLGVRKQAMASMYTGPSISEKTLVSWVSLQSTAAHSGSALAIDKKSVDEFDSIVYGERQRTYWMAGSSFFRRTQNPRPGFRQLETHALIQMAITYTNVNGNTRVRLYHDGILFGDYTQGRMAVWKRGDTEVFWGPRHSIRRGGSGDLDAHIEESRIYATVLTSDELKKLRPLCG